MRNFNIVIGSQKVVTIDDTQKTVKMCFHSYLTPFKPHPIIV